MIDIEDESSHLECYMLPFYLALIDDDESKSKFEMLYNQHKSAMLWTAMAVLNDQSLAEDAVHDAFIKIIDLLEKIDPDNCNRTRAFLVIITRNIAYDFLRRRKRRNEMPLDDFEEYMQDETQDLEEMVIGDESAQRISEAFGKINPSYANVLTLQYAFDMNIKEIAKLMNITTGNVKVQIHRGRAQIIKLLKEEE